VAPGAVDHPLWIHPADRARMTIPSMGAVATVGTPLTIIPGRAIALMTMMMTETRTTINVSRPKGGLQSHTLWVAQRFQFSAPLSAHSDLH
jgi:hypothetical protein